MKTLQNMSSLIPFLFELTRQKGKNIKRGRGYNPQTTNCTPTLSSLRLPPLTTGHCSRAPPPLRNSWSPDTLREEAWTNRKRNYWIRHGKFSVTDDDVEEHRGCFQLGFNFDLPDSDPKLSSAFPALGFYHAVNRQFSNSLSRSSSSSFSDCDSVLSVGSASAIIDPDDDPVIVKTRLKQWAQIVACSVRQSLPNYYLNQEQWTKMKLKMNRSSIHA